MSVLFADLVGFTPLSEARDAEAVRELLTQYFESCTKLISLYGGVVEKFIGDAVMAVWGSPTAREDDAERAVRAALELVSAVSALGAEVGEPGLQLRAGVLTGEASVRLGQENQGMVAGDLVNTASRIQSVAEPGSVYVGGATRRATQAAIAYADAGTHTLKGKAGPVTLYRALRVTAGRAGALRSHGTDVPFVERARELRLVKELFHAAAEERRAHLVSVIGVAGVGKSRLVWEFEKYADGLVEDVLWHRGRCLAYGEGVAYWALAEMVRMRCGIREDDSPVTARGKLQNTLEEYFLDPSERQWVEPRLAHLLALEEAVQGDQENLFPAWRTFFERIADQAPTVLVFEDMQWAEPGLLQFVEYLLEWSRTLPMLIVLLARPEAADESPALVSGRRNFSAIYLEPLPEAAMSELLTALVPGLPRDLEERILARAEGIPLYAVETVRMLLDRGMLEQDGDIYRPTGVIGTLEVPETLHALIAARLDGLGADERRVVQDAAVLGKVFTKQGLAALGDASEREIEPLLAALARKELIAIQADPRSPERGQHTFLQDLVKHIAYETISKKDRTAKHLAAAEFLLSLPNAEEGDTIEVVASHYLSAHANAGPAEAHEIRDQARATLVRAAERASSLAADAEAQRAFERALELSDDPLERARLHERAGTMAATGARADEAADHFQKSMALFEQEVAAHSAARVSARLAEMQWERGRFEQGLEVMERSLDVLLEEQPDADVASLAAQVARFRFFAGDAQIAGERIETALTLAEALGLPEVLSQSLNTKALLLLAKDRREEASVLMRHAVDVALAHDKQSAALRAYYNLADGIHVWGDRYPEAAETARQGLSHARKVGSRYWELAFNGFGYPFYALGLWDEVLALRAELPQDDWTGGRIAHVALLTSALPVIVERGRIDEANAMVDVLAEVERSADVQERCQFGYAQARLLLTRGDPEAALRTATGVVAEADTFSLRADSVKESHAIALEAAFALGQMDTVEDLLARVERLPAGRRPRFSEAQAARFRAHLAARADDHDAAQQMFALAATRLSDLSMPFHFAVVQLEHVEWLAATQRGADAAELVTGPAETFERLGATALFERAAQHRSSALPRTVSA